MHSGGFTRGFYEPFRSTRRAHRGVFVLARCIRVDQARHRPDSLAPLSRETLSNPFGLAAFAGTGSLFGLVPAIFVPDLFSPLSVTGFPAGWRSPCAQGRP